MGGHWAGILGTGHCTVQWTLGITTCTEQQVLETTRTLISRPRLRTLDEGYRTRHLPTNVLLHFKTDNGHLTRHCTMVTGHRTQDIGLPIRFRTLDSLSDSEHRTLLTTPDNLQLSSETGRRPLGSGQWTVDTLYLPVTMYHARACTICTHDLGRGTLDWTPG